MGLLTVQLFFEMPDGDRQAVRDGLVLGRVKGCDIVLDDAKVSRRHARLVLQGGVAEIEDLDSSNGTSLNGKEISRRLLRDGDRIQIGSTEIIFRELEDGAGGIGEADVPGRIEIREPAPDAAPPEAAPPPSAPEALPPAAKVPEVDRVEFADEVVEVRHREVPSGMPRPDDAAQPRVDRGVLQFSKHAKASDQGRGFLGDDMAQMSPGFRAGLLIAALIAALVLGYFVMKFVSG